MIWVSLKAFSKQQMGPHNTVHLFHSSKISKVTTFCAKAKKKSPVWTFFRQITISIWVPLIGFVKRQIAPQCTILLFHSNKISKVKTFCAKAKMNYLYELSFIKSPHRFGSLWKLFLKRQMAPQCTIPLFHSSKISKVKTFCAKTKIDHLYEFSFVKSPHRFGSLWKLKSNGKWCRTIPFSNS